MAKLSGCPNLSPHSTNLVSHTRLPMVSPHILFLLPSLSRARSRISFSTSPLSPPPPSAGSVTYWRCRGRAMTSHPIKTSDPEHGHRHCSPNIVPCHRIEPNQRDMRQYSNLESDLLSTSLICCRFYNTADESDLLSSPASLLVVVWEP